MSHQESKIFEGVMTRFWDDYGTALSSKDQAGTIYFNQLYFNKSLFIRNYSALFIKNDKKVLDRVLRVFPLFTCDHPTQVKITYHTPWSPVEAPVACHAIGAQYRRVDLAFSACSETKMSA